LAHALKKGVNEDLARKRLLRLGAEVRDLSGAAAEPERQSIALAGPRQDQKASCSGQSCGRNSVTAPRRNGTRRASLPHGNIRLMQPRGFGPAACSHCEQAA